MTLIFKQTIKLRKDAQSDVKPGLGGQTLCTCVLWVCTCSYAFKKNTKCMFTCSIGMLNIGSVMQL